ncbi:MAG: metal transporter, partial [Ignavibacteriaceae bacterium]|nr:metal transporter [Ignavibacteriaceae bacterium]
LNEDLKTNIDSENYDFDTLAGLILNFAGHIPKEGYTLELENYRFVIKEIINKRIKKVLIENIPKEDFER